MCGICGFAYSQFCGLSVFGKGEIERKYCSWGMEIRWVEGSFLIALWWSWFLDLHHKLENFLSPVSTHLLSWFNNVKIYAPLADLYLCLCTVLVIILLLPLIIDGSISLEQQQWVVSMVSKAQGCKLYRNKCGPNSSFW